MKENLSKKINFMKKIYLFLKKAATNPIVQFGLAALILYYTIAWLNLDIQVLNVVVPIMVGLIPFIFKKKKVI